MPQRVNSRYYDEYRRAVIKVRDCLDGEFRIKQQGTLYLPKPDGLTTTQYAAYKERAMFLGVAERALRGLTGIALRKDPVVSLPDRLAPMIESITLEGNSLDMLVEWVLKETLSVGYSALLLDFPRSGNTALTLPHVAVYTAENVLDYRIEMRDGVRKLTMVRLLEGNDDLSHEDAPERHLLLEADPIYTVRVMERVSGTDDFLEVSGMATVPVVNGNPLTHIPIVFPSPANLDPTPEKPPFQDMCDVNISHYRNSADLEHILYLSCAPTPYTSGNLNENHKPSTIGAGSIWHLPEGGEAGYIEPSGNGITHIREHMKSKEELMASIAARFINDAMNRNEQPTTAKMRTSGELSLLRGAIRSTEAAMRRLLQWSAEWTGNNPADVQFDMSTDLLATDMDPRMLDALSKSLMAGQISYSTFVYKLQEAEIIPRERSVEDEKELIELDGVGFDA